ncbi:MAG: uroporphyrinogen-III C-methyltransferase [Deltaproteobacteria bacterium]|nr:uroporphyrinogen-III C-methyltransferase [Deltaproteobacteria bacterium]
MSSGKVYLVGAGPGDPDLITVKGKRCLQQADVVIYDHLASASLLRHVKPNAKTIYVGKRQGAHTLPQEEMNKLLVREAKNGRMVVRLKGGHPFIFGRGGEEAEALAAEHIPFEVVPGITSAVAAPSHAGIPLTHRRYAASVGIVTGHEDPTKPRSSIDWGKLATGVGTLVILMGVKNLPRITREIMTAGRDPKTPVALVRWGTTPKQTTVVGTLETIVEKAEKVRIKPPVAIVVGDVVKLRDKLNWFETQPLFGKTVVVTRTRQQASEMVQRLAALGADCLECPTIRIVPPDDWTPLDVAIERLHIYDWLILTSVNGVDHFFDRLFTQGKDVRALARVRTATIGPATAKRLRQFGFASDIMPATYRAEAVLEAFSKEQMKGKKVLLPRAKEARPILPEELARMGAEVHEIAVYRTEPAREDVDLLIDRLKRHAVDLVTFTSSSTVKNFVSALAAEPLERLMEGVAVACIGPITADTARQLGLTVHIEASEYTIAGLCEAIVAYYAG